MTISPKIPVVAAIVAFAWGGLAVLYALSEMMSYLIAAAIPLAAGIGLLQRRVWAGYGFALYVAAGLLVTPFVLIRSGALTTVTLEIAVTVVVVVFLYPAVAVLFFLAGRSLAAAGARRGWAAPWITLSAASVILVLFVQAFVIPTGAMEDTLLIGDHVWFSVTRRPV